MHHYIDTMAFVSKKVFSTETQKRIRQQFIELFARQRTRKAIATVLDQLLTDTERMMVAKRIVLILMLHNNSSYYEIYEALGISTDTSARWHTLLKAGELEAITKSLKQKKSREHLLDTVEIILRSGMPPIAGRDRYSRTFQLIAEVKQKKRW
ncbi:hypothetical protein CL644_00185 [bacterium]|nr:hypothetical protein [Parcubacteria group bacterium]MBF05117.1 hypothetical protein [bacterium]|tara:strand:+ start:8994 stop:9452 length:459 start_codon:yes stop_codon:yes gene_type:complete